MGATEVTVASAVAARASAAARAARARVVESAALVTLRALFLVTAGSCGRLTHDQVAQFLVSPPLH